MALTAIRLQEIFRLLDNRFGALHWWPAQTPFEVVVGAVLTQNTNWRNVERSISSLKQANLLSFEAMLAVPEIDLAACITSSGYYNVKARRLKNLLHMIEADYSGRLQSLFDEDTGSARRALLGVKGIGPETADSILLYAGGHPVFVVDAYTHRIMSRHGMVPETCDYQTIQDVFMDNLEPDADMFNQYHALLVRTAKEFCKKSKPLCDTCPLGGID
ncbi:MAG: endonuclease III domain-containing protein [Desulfofustis sp.]|nr:endonuclease III domain-containing protein [Desulfofustis sp.]